MNLMQMKSLSNQSRIMQNSKHIYANTFFFTLSEFSAFEEVSVQKGAQYVEIVFVLLKKKKITKILGDFEK